MRYITTVIIGAGHSGLAMSRRLSERSIDHVLLERGEPANSWRKERWDSLRLLTPNWQSQLPGYAYTGDDPDGYMDMPAVIEFIENYAQHIRAPIQTDTEVSAVRRTDGGYVVTTDRGQWRCQSLVLASGACNVPVVPRVAAELGRGIRSITPMAYHDPDSLDPGGVLVVGASATGVQLAKEIQESGRQVTLAVSEHVRVPRVYRGRDIKWWMDVVGVMDTHYTEVDDIKRARRVPSLQLIGTPERVTLDLNTLRELGVELVGRVAGVRDEHVQFSGALANHCAMADLKMNRLLDSIDAWIATNELSDQVEPPCRFEQTKVESNPPLDIDLKDRGISTVLWATGYRPDYSWLHVPVFDRRGAIRHDGGVVDAPDMYVMGLPFLRRRKSSFICGATDDSLYLAEHLRANLRRKAA
jgi:putative flavoprotein involved in K+ transport